MSLLDSDDAAGVDRLSRELVSEPDTGTVHGVIELAQGSISGCDLAGFTLNRTDRVETVAATDPVIAELDQAQNELGEGPCLQAAIAEQTYLIRDTHAELRWPAWANRAARAGIRGVLSVQLTGPNHVRAALNLYSRSVDVFDRQALGTAQIYATLASNAVAANSEIDQLRTALHSRHTIGVAQGMLMNRYGLTEDNAFRFLCRLSQDTNTKLRDIAARLITEAACK